jgi:SHS2 domain-containing protein
VKERLYELFEHTADIGVRVRGKTLKELFRNSALTMFDIISRGKSENQKIRKSQLKSYNIKQKAENREELFINWLNELLSLSATKELIFSDLQIHKLNPKNLQATVTGSPIKEYELNTEIKAATYHGLKLDKDKSGWQAEVIFDV